MATTDIPQDLSNAPQLMYPLSLSPKLAETIQPKVDRWRSGLDALLVFLGLFSAINEVARTNELLANLTEILIQLSAGATLSTFKVSAPVPFQPDVVDLSIAALAVACRGFVNMTTLSSRKIAADKLMDINTRWKDADKMLGPALEVIPQLLVIPVILFVVGLLDSVFSNILRLEVLPAPILAASGLSLFFVTGVVGFLVFTLVDASFRPDSSPFQSTLSNAIRKVIPIKATHDDETLEKAAAALTGIFYSGLDSGPPRSMSHLNNTLVHLLSPEASTRCNHTAAQVIVHLLGTMYGPIHGPASLLKILLSPLTEATRRSANYRPPATLWSSAYIQAIALLGGALHPEHPGVVCVLGSSLVANDQFQLLLGHSLILDIFFDHLYSLSPDGSLTPAMVRWFEPHFVVPRHVLGFLGQLIIDAQEDRATLLISVLMAVKTPALVMAAARELIELDSHDNQLVEGLLFRLHVHAGCLVVKWFLRSSAADLPLDDCRLLAELCSTCIAAGKRQLSLLTSDERRFKLNGWSWFEILTVVDAALARLPLSPVSTALEEQMSDLKESYPDLFVPVQALTQAGSANPGLQWLQLGRPGSQA
ncbi:hypothetical protein B0H17DRAFT_1193567 [Mycena rosella]|uniref:DUF6535 domain-containing protein n=1 Tax=Mycena rosella TaxID=1033263 RepID=A0AAD7M768_MYCRO|nr:hypothetical protein B0H17DRAFT_1193567 [Mycena rosella]